ncbi:hypothetical protein FQA39_LY01741 [Lamprigera yunnana]|nr:hypothetical protein FQA39_LY01741 [Lamprigera yunnana]
MNLKWKVERNSADVSLVRGLLTYVNFNMSCSASYDFIKANKALPQAAKSEIKYNFTMKHSNKIIQKLQLQNWQESASGNDIDAVDACYTVNTSLASFGYSPIKLHRVSKRDSMGYIRHKVQKTQFIAAAAAVSSTDIIKTNGIILGNLQTKEKRVDRQNDGRNKCNVTTKITVENDQKTRGNRRRSRRQKQTFEETIEAIKEIKNGKTPEYYEIWNREKMPSKCTHEDEVEIFHKNPTTSTLVVDDFNTKLDAKDENSEENVVDRRPQQSYWNNEDLAGPVSNGNAHPFKKIESNGMGRIIQEDFSVAEEMLDLIPLHDTTKDMDIFKAANKVASHFGRFSYFVTHRAIAMIGTEIRLAELISTDLSYTALFAKRLHVENPYVMKVVVKITNIIRVLAEDQFRILSELTHRRHLLGMFDPEGHQQLIAFRACRKKKTPPLPSKAAMLPSITKG